MSQNNVLKLKVLKGGKDENSDSKIFTEGMIYGQYVLIGQIFQEFEECEFHERSTDWFIDFINKTELKSVKLTEELRKKILSVRKKYAH